MTRPRKALISPDTPYYHITSHCVPTALRGAGSTHSTSWGRLYPKHFVGQALRRAFLCGVDHYFGQSYEHRRQRVVDRIRLLSLLFAIHVCAYAVMSSHYHPVLKVCPKQLDDLSEDGTMDRWCALFKGPLLLQNYRSGEELTPFERSSVSDIVNVWRSKLSSISWFMRCWSAALQATWRMPSPLAWLKVHKN